MRASASWWRSASSTRRSSSTGCVTDACETSGSGSVDKRLLTIAEAASYSGLSYSSFRGACPVRPVRVRPGPRGLRYDVRALDDWITRLSSEEKQVQDSSTTTDWLSKLDDPPQDRRRQGLRQ